MRYLIIERLPRGLVTHVGTVDDERAVLWHLLHCLFYENGGVYEVWPSFSSGVPDTKRLLRLRVGDDNFSVSGTSDLAGRVKELAGMLRRLRKAARWLRGPKYKWTDWTARGKKRWERLATLREEWDEVAISNDLYTKFSCIAVERAYIGGFALEEVKRG